MTAAPQGITSGRSTPDVLARPRLEARLDEAFGKRLTVIVAGAGFGKSTLLGAWVRDVRAAWHTVTPDDVALAPFAAALVDALRLAVPELRRDLVDALEGPTGDAGDPLGRAGAFASLLSDALRATLQHDLVLVLDDVHELEGSDPSARLLERLCRTAPPMLHVVLSSRAEPPFAVQRLTAQGQVLTLNGTELAFSKDEVRLLLEGLGERDPLAAIVYGATGGWPAAVRLILESLRRVDPEERGAVVERATREQGSLFHYLAEEVFAREQPALRGFLARASLLPRLHVDLCRAIGLQDPATSLDALGRTGLLLPEGEGWQRLHALVREYGRATSLLGDAERLEIRLAAARWFEEANRLDEAATMLIEAGSPAPLADLLLRRGESLLAAGAVERVIEAGELVPRPRPGELEELVGQAYQIRGRWEDALACFERTSGGGGTHTRLPARTAWRIGVIHFLQGDPGRALEIYERAELGDAAPRDRALLLAWSATAHWLRGEHDRCREVGEQALAEARLAGDDQALAAAHIALGVLASMQGDRRADRAHLDRALAAAERAGDVLGIIRVRVNRQMPLLEDGAYEEALAELDVAVRLAELAGFSFFHALALHNRAEVQGAMGRIEESIADDEASRTIYEHMESRWICVPLAGLGDAYARRGDVALARAHFEQALVLGEQAEEVQTIVSAASGLALLLADEEPEEAARLVERSLSFGAWWGEVNALTAAGWVALARGDLVAARTRASEAAVAARARRSRAGLACALEVEALTCDEPAERTARLEQAVVIWRELGNPVNEARAELALGRLAAGGAGRARAERAERRLQALGVRTDAASAGLLHSVGPEHEPAIRIRTLGGFQVRRNGRPVPLTEWQSRKARDLLKILISRRGRPATREQLMESLWPGEPPGRVSGRLSVALSTLRGVLDPVHAFDPGHYLRADRQTVNLENADIVIDVEVFLREAAEGLALSREGRAAEAIERLGHAESLYSGDFLEEDAYEQWALDLREEARALAIEVARSLAAHASAEAAHDECARYLRRILERDGFDERAHLALVAALDDGGGHGEARRAYDAYTSHMEKIGVEPAAYPARP